MQQLERENMKNKKKLIDRIGIFICALVVFASLFTFEDFLAGETDIQADYDLTMSLIHDYCADPGYVDIEDSSDSYPYVVMLAPINPSISSYGCMLIESTEPIFCELIMRTDSDTPYYEVIFDSEGSWNTYGWKISGSNRNKYHDLNFGNVTVYTTKSLTDFSQGLLSSYIQWVPYYSNHNIYYKDTDLLVYRSTVPIPSVYNADLGYLQNIHKELQYLRGSANVGGVDLPLYTYDVDDSLKYVWTHDSTSSAGVDLTSGNFAIRHYITQATVTGYEKEDIIEESEMYLMNEYDASLGRFEYMQTDYDAKLEAYGYDGLSWIEKYLQGRFLLTHHYFQIVNLDTNEVGGYLHVYPKDADGSSAFESIGGEGNFGVEDSYEALDNDLNVDENGPSGYSEGSVGHGATYEEAEEDAKEEDLKLDLSGVDDFGMTMKSLSSQVGAVSSAIGSIVGLFPPWVTMILALSVALLVLVFVIKMMRG